LCTVVTDPLTVAEELIIVRIVCVFAHRSSSSSVVVVVVVFVVA